ncbi:helix-turn-helix transcriptional regulator [Chromobacterium piscinae]|uniref:helix-turn-helix transcriptional regulator n=1 Tax=Chromobacterium piscinae TaxID=686831 RepID=UPI0022AEFEEC|nr:helix-turn-helix transcriptional regulator [Chromobacterium piscinae]
MDLAARRKELKLTQKGVAEAIGCSQAHISNLERGIDNASPALAKKLAVLLRVKVEQVLFHKK